MLRRKASRLALGAFALSLGACTTPNVAPDIQSANTLLQQTYERAQPELQARAQEELRRAEDSLIAERLVAVQLSDCVAEDELGFWPDCRIESQAGIPQGTIEAPSASEVTVLFQSLRRYFDALSELAKSERSSDIEKALQELSKSIAGFEIADAQALARLTELFQERGDFISQTVGFVAEQARMATLRSVVSDADELIEESVWLIANYYKANGPLTPSHERLVAAWRVAQANQGIGDVAASRLAITDLRTAFDEFQRIRNESPVSGMIELRRLHAELLTRLTGPGTANEVLEVFQTIDAITTEYRG